MKLNYIIIPLVGLIVASWGWFYVRTGMEGWYKTIRLPQLSPNAKNIRIVWILLYFSTTTATLLFWNLSEHLIHNTLLISENQQLFLIAIVINMFINITWCYAFFKSHELNSSAILALFLALSTVHVIYLVWPISFLAALLYLPYLVWTCFITFLNYQISQLNKSPVEKPIEQNFHE